MSMDVNNALSRYLDTFRDTIRVFYAPNDDEYYYILFYMPHSPGSEPEILIRHSCSMRCIMYTCFIETWTMCDDSQVHIPIPDKVQEIIKNTLGNL